MLTTALASSVLYLLTRCPPAFEPYIQRILALVPFNAQLASYLNVNRPLLITLLKVFIALGLIHNASSLLTSVALNNWQWRSDRHQWEWSKEVAVVTGGCSGIGEEIVKGLARRGVRVVVLDVQEVPERLEDGMSKARLTILHLLVH
jgi:all-trans-retinol dehydrogenase (NAD+)